MLNENLNITVQTQITAVD